MWVSGVHVLEEMLRNKHYLIEEIFYCRKDLSDLIEKARSLGVVVKQRGREELNRLIGYRRHQGVVLRIKHFPYVGIDEIMGYPVEELSPLLLLDGIEDPQNLGSILRSAAFFGVKGVVIPEHRSVSVTDAVVRVSAGAISMVSVVRVPNLVRTIDDLSGMGFVVVGLDAHAGRSIYETALVHPIALVVGSEHRGMRRLVRERCHHIVKIPSRGEMESLNASVATAIALAEVFRQNGGFPSG